MLETYKAILHGDTLEWIGEKPSSDDVNLEVHVTVVKVQKQRLKPDGKAMAAALKHISDASVSASENISELEYEVQQDRLLEEASGLDLMNILDKLEENQTLEERLEWLRLNHNAAKPAKYVVGKGIVLLESQT